MTIKLTARERIALAADKTGWRKSPQLPNPAYDEYKRNGSDRILIRYTPTDAVDSAMIGVDRKITYSKSACQRVIDRMSKEN